MSCAADQSRTRSHTVMPRLNNTTGRLLVSGMAAALLLLAGCSGSSDPAAGAAPASAQVSSSPSPSVNAPSPTPSAAVSTSAAPKNRIDLVCSPDEDETTTA